MPSRIPSLPRAESQAAGLFVPQAWLLDTRLKPAERDAWRAFRSLADRHESLRTALLCAPGSHKAAPATVSRAVGWGAIKSVGFFSLPRKFSEKPSSQRQW
jgi:hypothetical protein